jgi:hypothetical protein
MLYSRLVAPKVAGLLSVGVAALSVATIGAPAAGAQGPSPSIASAPLEQVSGTTYVGATSNPDLFVAVVVGDSPQARAYLCDDTGNSEWLSGTLEDSVLQLTSTLGATVDATVRASAVSGTATLVDGDSVSFTAEPAEGVAGLYTSVVSADRRVQGTSSTGSTLDGVIAEHPLSGTDGQPVYPLVGLLTAADGEPVGFAVTLSGPHQPGETRSIVLSDGQQRGRSRLPGRVWVTDPMATAILDGTSNT